MKNKFIDKLPPLAKNGFKKMVPNQYVAFHHDVINEILSRNLMRPAIKLLLQLKPNQRIQYVALEEPEYAADFLEIGLIKPTKKVGVDRYVVPKTAAYCGIEPSY